MNDYEPTSPAETLPARPFPRTKSAPVSGGNSDATSHSGRPASSAFATDGPPSVTTAKQSIRPRVRRLLPSRRIGRLVAAALMAPLLGLSVGLATSTSAAAAQPASGSTARSGPAAGGSSGTVDSVSKSGFTLTTSTGEEVTVDETSSTKYEKGTTSAAKSAVAKGEHVLVLGTVSSTTIMATQVFVQTSGGGSQPSTAATVVPFQKGAAETSKQAGQIPASYRDPGRSSAERQPIRRPKPRWRPIQAESSTVS